MKKGDHQLDGQKRVALLEWHLDWHQLETTGWIANHPWDGHKWVHSMGNHQLDRPKMASEAMSLVPSGSFRISQPPTSVRVALFELYKPGTPEYAELFEDSQTARVGGCGCFAGSCF